MPRAFMKVAEHMLKMSIHLRILCYWLHHKLNKLSELISTQPVVMRDARIPLVIIETLE